MSKTVYYELYKLKQEKRSSCGCHSIFDKLLDEEVDAEQVFHIVEDIKLLKKDSIKVF